jgi:hypothetical protein
VQVAIPGDPLGEERIRIVIYFIHGIPFPGRIRSNSDLPERRRRYASLKIIGSGDVPAVPRTDASRARPAFQSGVRQRKGQALGLLGDGPAAASRGNSTQTSASTTAAPLLRARPGPGLHRFDVEPEPPAH